MNSSNPVLGKAYGQKGRRGYAAMDNFPQDNLEQSFNAPAASSLRTGRMTMDDVVARSAMLFGTSALVGAAAWYFNLGGGLLLLGFIGGLVTAMIDAAKALSSAGSTNSLSLIRFTFLLYRLVLLIRLR
mgnify:CR=1 FL=1